MIYRTPQLGAEELCALERIAELQRQLRYVVAEPRRWIGSVRRVLAARAIQGSNSIEGIHVSVEDALAAIEGEEQEEAGLSDRQAISGYRRALTYVIQLADDPQFTYAPALIRSLHFMMTEYALDASPGRWRPGPIWVRNDTSGEMVYEAPDAELIPGLIAELCADLERDIESPALVRGAMAHLNLVMIHPFHDGNGRMSRCLQTLVLAREQILAQELCSIEEYLGRNTDAYYQILADVGRGRWRPEGDALPWVRFCLTAHYVQAVSVLRRIRESEQLWLKLDELRLRHRLQERTLAALYDAAIGLRVRNTTYRTILRNQWQEDISSQVATLDLRAMVKAGLLHVHGSKRTTTYTAGEDVAVAAAGVRHDRQPISADELFTPDTELSEPTLPLGE